MKDRIAKVISGISSPYIMIVLFGLWSVAASVTTAPDFFLYAGLCMLLVAFLPAAFILLSIRRGHISDVHVAVREQRGKPFIVATAGAILLAVLYKALGAPSELIALAISLIVSGVVFGAITQFWKISIHAAAFTGSVTIVSFIIGPTMLWLLLFLPVIIWARLVRKRHDTLQVLAAAILNAACVSATLLIAGRL